MAMWDFYGKTILVTGASSGIGAETAKVLATLGARIVLVARNQELLHQVHQSLSGENHTLAVFDLNQASEISTWLLAITAKTGLIDGLVHCAGIHMARPLRFLTSENMADILKVNVTSGLMLAKAFRQKQISARPGSIVLLSSVMGVVGQAGVTPYAVSKGAVIAATKSLAVELAPENIRVNAVLPGVVKTPMSDKLFDMMSKEQIALIEHAHLLGLGESIDVANSIAFLLSDAAKWITGTCLTVDGGYTAV